MNSWRVTHHDGSLDEFGVSLTSLNDIPVITFANDRALSYLPPDTLIDITPTTVGEPATLGIVIIGLVTLFGITWRPKSPRMIEPTQSTHRGCSKCPM